MTSATWLFATLALRIVHISDIGDKQILGTRQENQEREGWRHQRQELLSLATRQLATLARLTASATFADIDYQNHGDICDKTAWTVEIKGAATLAARQVLILATKQASTLATRKLATLATHISDKQRGDIGDKTIGEIRSKQTREISDKIVTRSLRN